MRIANGKSGETDKVPSQQYSSPNPGSIDKAQKVYQAINLKESAKRGQVNSRPSEKENGGVRVIEKPDYSAVGGGPIATANIDSETGSIRET